MASGVAVAPILSRAVLSSDGSFSPVRTITTDSTMATVQGLIIFLGSKEPLPPGVVSLTPSVQSTIWSMMVKTAM